MTRKSILRKMQESDLELVLKWRNSPEIRKNMYYHGAIGWETHVNWFKRVKKDHSFKHFIFEYKGIPSGVISFSQIDHDNKRASWAFYSGRLDVKGLGTQMELIALEYAFEMLKLNKLCCEVLSFNDTVIRFHKKFGFVEEGVLVNHYWRDGKAYDVYLLAFYRKEWLATKENFFYRHVK